MHPIARQSEDTTIEVRTFGVTFGGGFVFRPEMAVPPRAPDWDKLIYATRGVLTVRNERSAWVAPPHRGVWIPAGMDFQVETSAAVAMRILYILAGRAGLARDCSVVNVTPLLRELICRAVRIGALDSAVPEQARLAAVIFDELKLLTTVPLYLPSPRDERAARFAAAANTAPAISAVSLGRTLRACGTSRRTMERLFQTETGMSLGQWLRRHRLLHGLRRLAAGECVNSVALELGYNGPSAFIAMFRRELGQTPKQYFQE
jgi:AraC-like DNA-binding protein